MNTHRRLIVTLFFFGLIATAAHAQDFTAEQLEHFEKQIRPLLAANCYECHSGRAKRLEAKLRLDSRVGALKGGDSGPAIVPGKPDESLLISAVKYDSFEMPPRGKLPADKIAALVKWVEMGAPWPKESAPTESTVATTGEIDWRARKEKHWAWRPIVDPPPPAVKDAAWPKSPIDRFILAKLEEKGLSPASPADRRTLVRRLYFDLIGLPPEPEQVAAFVADESPDAYEKVVDSLLESKHFGEKWARHWMDLVRYAETHGHEFDYPIANAFQYRDYLIRAFNADVPYAQFVTEHIAGDLLPQPRKHPAEGFNESVIATGFWFFGEATHAPTDVRGDEAIRIDNQIDVMTKTFLGLTVGCARCHDHKFDAMTSADYYALTGFLQSSRRQEAMIDPGDRIHAAAEKLLSLRQQGSEALRGAITDGKLDAATFAAYLLAAREAVVRGEIATAAGAGRGADPNAADILFADFESETYQGWTATGDAFGLGPAKGTAPNQQVVSGFAGSRLVNSYPGNDGAKGTLTSAEFTIERPFINLLVGGGHHADRTCVNLLVDGRAVRTAVGKGPTDNEKLSPRTWDVREFAGRKAKFQIVDNESGGWGHINVDQIAFANQPTAMPEAAGVASPPLPPDAVIAQVAADRGLSAPLLKRWVRASLDPALREPSHPLHAWFTLSQIADADPAAFAVARQRLVAELDRQIQRAAESRRDSMLLADFDRGDWNGWLATGEAFGPRPTVWPEWDAAAAAPDRLVQPGLAHSGLSSRRLQGVLRSPTFEITQPNIHYRLNATGVRIRLIIDGYFMDTFNGLLFGGAAIGNVDTAGQFRWLTQSGDLRNYIGRTAYIEIYDEGDGFAAVDEIRLSAGGAPSDSPPNWLADLLRQEKIDSRKTLAAAYAAAWQQTRADIAVGKSPGDRLELVNWLTSHQLLSPAGDPNPEPPAAITAVAAEARSAIEPTIPPPQRVLAITDGSGEDDRIHLRGNPKNLGPVVPRRLLLAIAGERQPPIASGSGRLELAQRMTDPNDPFLWRVMANRVWHHLFGRGIVPTVDDFGAMGQPPSHPELLDWLARDFRDHGGSIKRLIRGIVLSKTYQQSSRVEPSPELEPRIAMLDPDNRLLHRMPIRRLPGESIRDAMLLISGRLDRSHFGPSVPVHLTPFMEGRGRPGSGPLDGAGRRSVYLEVRRNFLSPLMLAFDMPSPFSTMGRRSDSNVPAQSLILMNDPFVVEESRRWSARLLAAHPDPTTRLTFAFEQAFARPPTPAQLAAAQSFLARQSQLYNASPDDPRVWTDLCHTLFNMKEFIFLN